MCSGPETHTSLSKHGAYVHSSLQLNAMCKMGAPLLANRIKSSLSLIMNEYQKDFHSGRFIGGNIRMIYDLMFYTEELPFPGLLL